MRKLWLIALTVCLGGCAGDVGFNDHRSRAPAPFAFLDNKPLTGGEAYLENEQDVYRPMGELDLAQAYDTEQRQRAGFSPEEPSLPVNCSLGDRFDREALVAYNFSDGQSRLSLNMKTDDIGLGGVEVEQVMLRFKYKLQPIPHRKYACKYPSGFQGLIGSGYNEFVRRERNTVWQELRDNSLISSFVD